MRLILGAINGDYLRNITENCADQTEEVWAAVAYALDSTLLFEWCWNHQIPLKFYGRLDASIAVSSAILKDFLNKKSPTFACRLVQHHHAKVIWWRNVGMYIGSANLTNSAWYKNIEAGCFFSESEITDEMADQIGEMFARLESHSTPLSEELLKHIEERERTLAGTEPPEAPFWKSPSITTWPGLVHVAPRKAADKRRQEFLEEWYSTLQEIRNIAEVVSRPENRPSWVDASAPPGTQADQFLHAHYYERTFDGRKANYAQYYENNKNRRNEALNEAIAWWRNLSVAPQQEDTMLNDTAPRLRSALSEERLQELTYEQFHEVCSGVHAIIDYSRRVSNKAVGLPTNGTAYTIPEKVAALSRRIWNDQSAGGIQVGQLLLHVLYGGTSELLPERLWLGVSDPKWKIDGLGISALGELVGWALPHRFPPRNGRTSKSLKSLGINVKVHVE